MTSKIERMITTIDEQHGWDRRFREIKSTSAAYDLSCKAAKLQINRNRNRYRDVSPYDHNRVKLMEGPNDYINGSLLTMEKAGRRYILSQGPLPGTSGHLWQMAWEQNSRAVIMLNKVIEKGTLKCHQYWPLDIGDTMTYVEEGYEISLVSETVNTNFAVRTLKLSQLKSSESRTIFHFHYIAWPDFGVPESPNAFLEFLTCVRSYKVLEEDVGPPIIHCSAGIGRSGTFALVDTCFVYLQRKILFDIEETLLEMRKYRMGLIQTAQQLRFSYVAIAECDKKIQSEHAVSVSNGAPDTDDNQNQPAGKNKHVSEKSPDDQQHKLPDEPKESRKRHADDPKGPTEEKRGKQEGNTITQSTLINKASDENNVTHDGLRQRSIKDKNDAIRKKVDEIKKNMQAGEKQHPWKKYIIGGLFLTIAVGIAWRYWYS